MEVFTHYKEHNKVGLRWRTLLRYGDSWDIIGSMVMINPGSSKPLGEAISDNELLVHLGAFDKSGEAWFSFSEDAAMRHTGELFAKLYGKENRHQLNGVIQIFNLFYIMNPDLESALDQDRIFLSENIYPSSSENDANQLVAPVYLGYGKNGHDVRFREKAQIFFEQAVALNNKYKQGNDYLDVDFSKNPFTYPSYLMGRGKNQNISKVITTKFLTLK